MAYTIEDVDKFNETWKTKVDELGGKLITLQQEREELTARVVELEAKADTARQIKDGQAKLIADLRQLLLEVGTA